MSFGEAKEGGVKLSPVQEVMEKREQELDRMWQLFQEIMPVVIDRAIDKVVVKNPLLLKEIEQATNRQRNRLYYEIPVDALRGHMISLVYRIPLHSFGFIPRSKHARYQSLAKEDNFRLLAIDENLHNMVQQSHKYQAFKNHAESLGCQFGMGVDYSGIGFWVEWGTEGKADKQL